MENQKTKTYWNIGKHIHEHMLNYSGRADYGDYLFKRIVEELEIGKRTLYRAVQFYKTYPEIVSGRTQLNWSHLRILISVDDDEKRNEYKERVLNENLNATELEELVKREKKLEKQKNRNPTLIKNS